MFYPPVLLPIKIVVFISIIASINNISNAQINESFTDGDFLNSPAWIGKTADWQIENQELRLKAEEAGSSYLSTASEAITEASWEFSLRMDFNPSSANFATVYLVASDPDLEAGLNGYYVKIGGTEDEVSLYYQQGSTTVKLIDGMDDRVDFSGVPIRVKVTRSGMGNWNLYCDPGISGNYLPEGTAIHHELTRAGWFGLQATYTSTRSDRFYFDDILVSGEPFQDQQPPVLLKIEVLSEFRLSLYFSEAILPESAAMTEHYNVLETGNTPLVASINENDPSRVELTMADAFKDASFYNLQVNNLSDPDGNVMTNQTLSFFYYQEKLANPQDIIINEVMPDPSPPKGLPETEYIELYNASDKPFNLHNWQIADNSGSTVLDSVILRGGEYLILVPDGQIIDFANSVPTLAVADWQALNNGADKVNLSDHQNRLIDSVFYTTDTYGDSEKSDGGWSLERIAKVVECPQQTNWLAPADPSGGTPGRINSRNGFQPDSIAPKLIKVEVTGTQSILITFSEIMDENSLQNATYQLNGGLEVLDILPGTAGLSVQITTSGIIRENTEYLLEIMGAADCPGNLMPASSFSFRYDISPPEWQELIIESETELRLIFNEPLQKQTAEKTDNYRLNRDVQPEKALLWSENEIWLAFASPFIENDSLRLIINSLSDLNGNILTHQELKTVIFSSRIDTVFVSSSSQLSIRYLTAPRLDHAVSTNAYWLDNLVNPLKVWQDEAEPQTFHLLFAEDLPDNQLLYLYVRNVFGPEGRLHTPAFSFINDTRPADIAWVEVLNAMALEVVFTEKLDSISAVIPVNYRVNRAIGFPSEVLFLNDSSVRLRFSESWQQQLRYRLEVDYLRDLAGNITSASEHFFFDDQPAELVRQYQVHPDRMYLQFSEALSDTSAENPDNYYIESLNINKVRLMPGRQDLIELTLEPWQPDATYTLQVYPLSDVLGTSTKDTLVVPFSLAHPRVGNLEILSDSSMILYFNKPVLEPEPGSFIMNQDTFPLGLIHEGHRITLTFEHPFGEKMPGKLQISALEDDSGHALDTVLSATYNSRLTDLSSPSNNVISLKFENPVNTDALPEYTFLLQPSGHPLMLLPDSDNERIMHLVFTSSFVEGQPYQLFVRPFRDNYEQLIPASKHTFIYDNTPPEVTAIDISFPQRLLVTFSEALSTESQDKAFFKISGDHHPEKVEISGDKASLSFSGQLADGLIQLTVNGIKDLAGNRIDQVTKEFIYQSPQQAGFADLIITEVMAKPVVEGAYSGEYIEIYNRSGSDLPLFDIWLSDLSDSVKLPDAWLEAGSYAILTTSDHLHIFDSGKIFVTPLPALNNDGETIQLIRGKTGLLHQVSYRDSWYKDYLKARGGWSLEMIDTDNPCAGIDNWMASADPSGGTPGRENSVKQPNPDNQAPELYRAIAKDDSSLTLWFSEALHPDRLPELEVAIDPPLVIQSIIPKDEPETLQLLLQDAPKAGQPYTVSVRKAFDCLENLMDEENRATFYLPQEAEYGDLAINEIMYNPAEGGAEFIELYNVSNKHVQLNSKLAIKIGDQSHIITLKDEVLAPGNFAVLTEYPDLLLADYPGSPTESILAAKGFPVLQNQGNGIALCLADTWIDSVYYDPSFHMPLIKNDQGVSLERIFSDRQALDKNNWQSAASSVGFATPGLVNSQSGDLGSGTGRMDIAPATFSPFDPSGRTFTNIHYSFARAGKLINLSIHDVHGRKIRTLASHETVAANGHFKWDGYMDNATAARLGAYLVVMEVYDLSGNLQILKGKVAVGGHLR